MLARRGAVEPSGRHRRRIADRIADHHTIAGRERAAAATCRARLRDTSHFHVDLAGRYVPGLCAGIDLPLAEVPGSIDLARCPVLAALVGGGPATLADLARRHGFTPHDHYGSGCDRCAHARTFLHGRGGYAELGPSGFYDPRSVGH